MRSARKIYDWPAIRAFYDRGRTPAECQREFGVTNGAWHGAVQRGAIVLRTYTPRSSARRAAVAELFASGCSRAEIARELDISRRGLTLPSSLVISRATCAETHAKRASS